MWLASNRVRVHATRLWYPRSGVANSVAIALSFTHYVEPVCALKPLLVGQWEALLRCVQMTRFIPADVSLQMPTENVVLTPEQPPRVGNVVRFQHKKITHSVTISAVRSDLKIVYHLNTLRGKLGRCRSWSKRGQMVRLYIICTYAHRCG